MKSENFTYERNNIYRRQFFEKRKGLFKGKLYFCAYCGKPMPCKKTTVDHILPVNSVKYKHSLSQKLLEMQNIHDINDIKNLAPACERCNKRKGAKGGLWAIKGFLGRSQVYQLILWLLLLVTLIALILPNIF